MAHETIDLRSYYPKFERTITWWDGTVYYIREITELAQSEFATIIDEEKGVAGLPEADRAATAKRHMRLMLVTPMMAAGTAGKGQHQIRVDGDGAFDLVGGDTVFISGGLYVERNFVEKLDDDGRTVTLQRPLRFDADHARIYRAIRDDAFDPEQMTMDQFWAALRTVKTAPEEEDGGAARPPTAAAPSS